MRQFIVFLIALLFCTPTTRATVRSFDGANDEVDMGNVINITTGDVSWCGWFNPTNDTDAFDWLDGKKNTAGTVAGYATFQQTTNRLSCSVADGTTELGSSSTTGVEAAWGHICCTWDGANDDLHLYLNGTEEDTDTSAGLGSLSNAVEFAVGESGDENSSDYAGLAAFVQVFTRELTAVEANELRYIPDGNGDAVAGFWMLNGGSPEQDWSGNNRDGTVSNATTNSGGPPVMLGHQYPL